MTKTSTTATRKKCKVRRSNVKVRKGTKQASKHIVSFPAIPFAQNGIESFFIVADHRLLSMLVFDIYDHQKGRGTNRDDKLEKRAADFANFITTPGQFCPNAGVWNDLDNACTIERTGPGRNVTLHFDLRKKLTVREGQGRSKGYTLLADEGIYMEFPVFITKTSEAVAIDMTWSLNTKRKNFPTDMRHCQSLQIVRSELRKKKALKAIERQKLSEAIAFMIIQHMNANKKSPFYKVFVMPNQKIQTTKQRKDKFYKNPKDGTLNHRTIKIPCHTHGNSLKSIVKWQLNENSFRSFDKICDHLSSIIIDFWRALREVNPTIFDNPKPIVERSIKLGQREVLSVGYHTQTRKGCFVLYPLLLAMLQRGIATKKEFKRFLSKSKTIKNVDFWAEVPGKRDGIHVQSSTSFMTVRYDILNEMGLGV